MRRGLIAITLLLAAVDAWAQTCTGGQLSISPQSLPNGNTSTSYPTQTLSIPAFQATYAWSVSSGQLPPGLFFSPQNPNPWNATISGTPTTQGSFSFTVRVDVTFASGGMQFGCQPYTVTISGSGLTIMPTTLPGGAVNQSYTQQLSTSPNVSGTYNWSFSGQLPPGLSLNPSSGLISGTANTQGTFYFTVNVLVTFPGGQSSGSQNYIVGISTTGSTGFAITTTILPDGALNQLYSQQLTTNAPTNITVAWSYGGSLPPGLTLGQSTGVISGTATSAGTYTFTVTATEQVNTTAPPTASQTLSIRITGSSLSIVENSLPAAAQGSPYSVTLTGTGGVPPYQWSFGSPNTIGFGIVASTGTISGTPSASGSYTLIVILTDSVGVSIQRTYSLFVATPLRILNTSLANGTAGTSYSDTLMPGGGQAPYQWSVASGNLPPGLTLNRSTGAISGTPTTNGTYPITVQLSDFGNRTATADFKITIGAPPPPLTITTTSLPDGAVGVAYSQTLSATGGATPLTWSIVSGTLPGGLTLSATGVISGTPTNVSTLTFTVQVTDASNVSKQATLTINVTNPPNPPTITTGNLTATAGVLFSQTLAGSGGTPPYKFSITGSLPAGLQFDPATGTISGTPTAPGSSTLGVSITDSIGQTATKTITLTVNPNPPTITTGNLTAIAGVPFSATLAGSGGTPPYKFSIAGSLPAGLGFDAATATISGTPSAPGTSNIVVTITDSIGQTATKTITLTVNPPPSVNLSGVPTTAPSNTQQPLTVSTGTAPATALDGSVILTFASAAAGGRDDAMIGLCNGSRLLPFTIPANSTQGVFPFGCTPNVVRTGTTAGRITLTAHINNGGPDSTANIDINPARPVITSATFQQQTSGFAISVNGFSNTGELMSATFDLVPASNNTFATSHFVVPLSSAAATWFQNPTSTATGGSFTATFPFSVQGNAQAVVSYKVTVTNAQGDSNTFTGNP